MSRRSSRSSRGIRQLTGNRADRRREAKRARVSWRDIRAAEKAEGVALRMSPVEAREALARWAAQPGRSQAEVDALNAKGGSGGIAENQ